MEQLDRPLATTTQFRAAVRRVCNVFRGGYTDAPKGQRTPETDKGKRYVLMHTSRAVREDFVAIEFILWSQGVTANTRGCSTGVRGTCVLSNFNKEKQNV